jgi:hypothetical protein
MISLRSIALSSVLLLACTQDAPAPPQAAAGAPPTETALTPPGSPGAKRLPPGDPHAEPPPGEDAPPTMAVMPAAKGTFDVTRDGKVVHFAHLPPGQNRAIVLADGETGRVSVAASETEEGQPHLRILIEGLRPDRAQYPITIGSTPAKDAKAAKKGPSLTMRYEVHDLRVYVTDSAKGADMQVTLEGFEGSTLRGRFEGKLAPTAAGLGEPIPLSGKFAVELGLQGVQPGPAPAAAAD